MREILSDLVAEEQALDQFLQKIPIREWKRPVQDGRSIQDIVAYLATTEDFVADVIEQGAPVIEQVAASSVDEFVQDGIERGRSMRPQDVIEWWRAARARVVDALSRTATSDRIAWFDRQVAAQTLATTRLAETWARALEVHAAMGAELEDSARLRHISWLAWRALPHAFAKAGLEYRPVRVEVIGPAYAKWVFGPEDTDQLIKGPAGHWCRLAAGFLDVEDTALRAEGDVAEQALNVVDLSL